jgi:hypothetical protein
MYRHALLIIILLAGVRAVEIPSWMNDVNDWRIALGRDPTADDYRERRLELPAVAKSVTSIEDGQSYIVKLECLGCPSRNRLFTEASEQWEDVVQDTSLASLSQSQLIFYLTNYTVAAESHSWERQDLPPTQW